MDAFEDAIGAQLKDVPTMPATVIAERVGWTGGLTVFQGAGARAALRNAVLDILDRPVIRRWSTSPDQKFERPFTATASVQYAPGTHSISASIERVPSEGPRSRRSTNNRETRMSFSAVPTTVSVI